ncbi:MAG: HU family DNA-binding protein [Pseudonocardiaceae bacterium]
MNKAQLIDALAERLGDKKVAAAAVAGLVDVVIQAVKAGDKVTITGFGVFEKRARAARVARNPRTGEAVALAPTEVPVFRPGTLFREAVGGARQSPRLAAVPAATTAAPKAKPAKVELAKVELAKVELAKVELAKVELAKVEPTPKSNAKGPAKGAAKKTDKKSAIKKLVTKKSVSKKSASKK